MKTVILGTVIVAVTAQTVKTPCYEKLLPKCVKPTR